MLRVAVAAVPAAPVCMRIVSTPPPALCCAGAVLPQPVSATASAMTAPSAAGSRALRRRGSGVVRSGTAETLASLPEAAGCLVGALSLTGERCRASAPTPVYSRAVAVDTDPEPVYEQDDQPPGVPPLALTGERTLPDVPAENYWFRRHLAVYEWIATRVAGCA